MNDEPISEFEQTLIDESQADQAADQNEVLGDEEHCCLDDEPAGMTDVEADADTLASAGMGTDEDYEHHLFDDASGW